MQEGAPRNENDPENPVTDEEIIARLQSMPASADDPLASEDWVEAVVRPWKEHAMPTGNSGKELVEYHLRLGRIFLRAGMLTAAKTCFSAVGELGAAADYDFAAKAHKALATIADDRAVQQLNKILKNRTAEVKGRIEEVMNAWEKEAIPNFLSTTRVEDAKNAIRRSAILLRAGLDQEARTLIRTKIIARKIFPFGADQKKSTELLTRYLNEIEATQEIRDAMRRLIEEEESGSGEDNWRAPE